MNETTIISQQLKTLAESITRIRQPLALNAIFQNTATEVRQILKANRVAIFKFYPEQDWEGEFVSEDVTEGWSSVLAERVYDHCFGEQFAPQYHQGKVQAVADIQAEGISECHLEILGRFQIRANLVVPVLQGQNLWGLLCIHQCESSRQWQKEEIEFVQQIAEHFGVAVQQADYISKAEIRSTALTHQIEREKALAKTISKVRQSLEIDVLFKSVVTEVRKLLKADRAAVFQFDPKTDWEGEFVSEDVIEGCTSVLAERVYDHCFGEGFAPQYHQGRVQAVADIQAELLHDCHKEILGRFQVRSNLVVPVLQKEKLWGLLCVHQCTKTRQWSEEDIEFVRQIADHLGIALKQVAALEQGKYQAEQQKALTGVITRIRNSLDLKTIFQTTVKEVRQLLQVDRAGIFEFSPENGWDGCFVAEGCGEGVISALDARVHDHCFGDNYATLYQQGRIFVSPNIYESGLQNCHEQILEQFQVKANVVAPLTRGEDLWGLLCIHQCHRTREWQESEVEFIRQIAEQLSVALTQDQQVEQLKVQAAQLADANSRERSLERQKLLTQTINSIRQSLEIKEIFNTTTQSVWQLLKANRVVIYRFNADWSGEFVAESHDDRWTSLMEKQQQFPELGQNISDCSAKLLAEKSADTYLQETKGGPFTQKGVIRVCNDIYTSGFSDCYLEFLEKYEAKAYIISALYRGEKLWGLLAAFQNDGPREWSNEDSSLLGQVSSQLGIALQQAHTLEVVSQQATELKKATVRQAALAKTVDKIRQSLDIDDIFTTTTYEVRQLLEAERIAIYQFNPDWSGDFVAESMAEGWKPLVGVKAEITDTYLMENQGGRYIGQETFIVDDIYETGFTECHMALLETFQARAYAIVPIMAGNDLWGLLAAYQNSGPRHWETDEIELLVQVGSQLGIALQQAESVAQVQRQAAALKRATERQNALSRTIDKIRQSLDIDSIFNTTTQEVRQLLDVDRVAIYRFNSDWSGAFVADSIVDGWQPTIPSQTVIEDVFSQPNSEGKYPRNEMFVPISQGEQLWGLLMAYQTSNPRYWEDDEVSLLTQVGAQLGIALQQAELLKQTQQQTKQLNQTVQELQSTQARLIQGEKMAGLGHLVAGIAHEINNPTSFIFGNIQPAKDYVKELLELIQLYRQHYPEPKPVIQETLEDIDIEFVADDLRKLLQSMYLGASRIKDIVQGMRIFSRMDEAALKEVDIHQGIDSTLLILGHRLKDYGERPAIQVIKSYGELPLINCYAGQLNQVFMNLLSNAIDALEETSVTNKTPQIRIITHCLQEQNKIEIQFEDNGPGIPEDLLKNVFNPFFTTKPVGKGTGLGLSISYHIIAELHGGILECLSSSEEGTTFRIELPIQQSALTEEKTAAN